MPTFACQVCGKNMYEESVRLCRWRVARVEFVPNGSLGPVPVLMARCLRCKQHTPIPIAEMVQSAQRTWDRERR